jgi:putative phosphoribosyl transferase
MFNDRAEAGRALAERLAALAPADPVVLALPRGGVPVAVEIAARLKAPLDLLLVRKIGVPGHEELAAGAVVEGVDAIFNADVLRHLRLSEDDFAAAVATQRDEIARRRGVYLSGRAAVTLAGRTAVLVDDGIATGATVRAALGGLALRQPGRTILAVPVSPPEALEELRPLVDDLICLEVPQRFRSVGAHYRDFHQIGDAEVAAALRSTGEAGS